MSVSEVVSYGIYYTTNGQGQTNLQVVTNREGLSKPSASITPLLQGSSLLGL